jgi:hypothetical protein
MMHAAGVLVFVAVLAARPGTREPLDAEIVVGPFGIGIRNCDIGIDDGASHGARVDTAPTFSWWDTLDAMPTGFVYERGETFAFDFDGDLKIACVCWALPNDAELSTLAGEQSQICVRKVFDEKLTVSPAFGRAKLDNALHDVLLVGTIPTHCIYTSWSQNASFIFVDHMLDLPDA